MQDYFLPMSNSYTLEEQADSGRSMLKLQIENENLCIHDFDHKKKCGFLRPEKEYGMQKSVDHIIFEKGSDGWNLHLVEMKSSVGYKTWMELIRPKVRTSYLTALAIADFLGITIQEVTAYTTYEQEKFDVDIEYASPRARVPFLGMQAADPFRDEWKKDCMYLNFSDSMKITHRRVKMVRNASTKVLEGSLTL